MKKLKHVSLGKVLCKTELWNYYIWDLVDNFGDWTSIFVYNRDWLGGKYDTSEDVEMYAIEKSKYFLSESIWEKKN